MQIYQRIAVAHIKIQLGLPYHLNSRPVPGIGAFTSRPGDVLPVDEVPIVISEKQPFNWAARYPGPTLPCI